jgi:hypothetical protein
MAPAAGFVERHRMEVFCRPVVGSRQSCSADQRGLVLTPLDNEALNDYDGPARAHAFVWRVSGGRSGVAPRTAKNS